MFTSILKFGLQQYFLCLVDPQSQNNSYPKYTILKVASYRFTLMFQALAIRIVVYIYYMWLYPNKVELSATLSIYPTGIGGYMG